MRYWIRYFRGPLAARVIFLDKFIGKIKSWSRKETEIRTNHTHNPNVKINNYSSITIIQLCSRFCDKATYFRRSWRVTEFWIFLFHVSQEIEFEVSTNSQLTNEIVWITRHSQRWNTTAIRRKHHRISNIRPFKISSFVKLLANLVTQSEDILVNFDVTSLIISVSINDAINIIRDSLG